LRVGGTIDFVWEHVFQSPGEIQIMAGWTLLKWLLWASLYLVPIVLLPWALSRAWVHQHGGALQLRPKHLFQRGELGLLSLILGSSVIWDLLQSQFMPHTIALGLVALAFSGIMAASVWVETYCRQRSGTDWHRERAWSDSWSLALLVFSMAAVIEILLDRLAKVASQ
jgi:hypothetical protein